MYGLCCNPPGWNHETFRWPGITTPPERRFPECIARRAVHPVHPSLVLTRWLTLRSERIVETLLARAGPRHDWGCDDRVISAQGVRRLTPREHHAQRTPEEFRGSRYRYN